MNTSSYNLLGNAAITGGLSHGGTYANYKLSGTETAGLLALDYYGGKTKSHALSPTSLAINRGSDTKASLYDLAFDQRGSIYDRVLSDHVDIGAVEAHAIDRDTVFEFYGTGANDRIFVHDDQVKFFKDFVTSQLLATYTIDLESVEELRIYGLAGDDKIEVYSGDYPLAYFYGVNIPSVISGGDGDDDLTGGRGADTIYGGDGNDSVDGQSSDDLLFGGNGNDLIIGRDGDDELNGEVGDDYLFGGYGTDTLNGGSGEDIEDSGDVVVTYRPEVLYGASGSEGTPGPSFSAPPPSLANEPDIDHPITPLTNPGLYENAYEEDMLKSQFYVSWDITTGNFIGPTTQALRATQIGVIQVVKTTVEYASGYGWESFHNWLDKSPWHVDTLFEPAIQYRQPIDAVYPFDADSYDRNDPDGFINAWPDNSRIVDLNPQSLGDLQYLAIEDYPGTPFYKDAPEYRYNVGHMRQEFETYVIALAGPDGLMIDEYFYDGTTTPFARSFKNLHVYGGISWYHDFVLNEQTSAYTFTRQVNTTMPQTGNLEDSLHRFFDYYDKTLPHGL